MGILYIGHMGMLFEVKSLNKIPLSSAKRQKEIKSFNNRDNTLLALSRFLSCIYGILSYVHVKWRWKNIKYILYISKNISSYGKMFLSVLLNILTYNPVYYLFMCEYIVCKHGFILLWNSIYCNVSCHSWISLIIFKKLTKIENVVTCTSQ